MKSDYGKSKGGSNKILANGMHMIQENSNTEQWKYVPSKENSADDAFRGMNFKKFANNDR